MINSVRQTVMSTLNKNNYGYISPSDFNLFAKQAQLDIFENYFYQYNYQLNKENARASGTGYADITKGIEEVIDTFSVTKPLAKSGGVGNPMYFLPSQITTNDDYYLINKNLVYNKKLAEGVTTGFAITNNVLEDNTADFIAAGIQSGDAVGVEILGVTYLLRVVGAITATTMVVNTNLFTSAGNIYYIYKKDTFKEAEKVTHSKITMLNNSILTAPNLMFPAYTQEALEVELYPESIDGYGQVVSQYIRFPFVPKWTFVTLTNGEPSFDPSQPDYQDFELPNDDEVNLINKILQYAGMSIREIEAVQFAAAEDQQNNQEEK